MTKNGAFLIALLVAIAALASACGGSVPSTGVDPVDAATFHPETAVAPDAPASQPDVAGNLDVTMVADTAVAPDAPSPPDVVAVEDRSAPPPDAAAPFSTAAAAWLESSMVRVRGSIVPPETPIIEMRPDGRADAYISSGLAASFGCGNTEGICSGTTCVFGHGSSFCSWTDVMVGVREFHGHSPTMPNTTIDVTNR